MKKVHTLYNAVQLYIIMCDKAGIKLPDAVREESFAAVYKYIIFTAGFAKWLCDTGFKIVDDNLTISAAQPRVINSKHPKTGQEMVREMPAMIRITKTFD